MEQHRHRRGHSTNPAAAILRPACGIIGAAPMRGAVGMRSLWKSLAVRWLGGRASEALVGEITPLELLLSEAAPTAPTFAVRRLAAVSPRALLAQQPRAALRRGAFAAARKPCDFAGRRGARGWSGCGDFRGRGARKNGRPAARRREGRENEQPGGWRPARATRPAPLLRAGARLFLTA